MWKIFNKLNINRTRRWDKCSSLNNKGTVKEEGNNRINLWWCLISSNCFNRITCSSVANRKPNTQLCNFAPPKSTYCLSKHFRLGKINSQNRFLRCKSSSSGRINSTRLWKNPNCRWRYRLHTSIDRVRCINCTWNCIIAIRMFKNYSKIAFNIAGSFINLDRCKLSNS